MAIASSACHHSSVLEALHLSPNPVQFIARGVSTLAAASTVVAMLVDSSKPLEVDLRDVPGRSLVRSCAGVLRVGRWRPSFWRFSICT